MRVQLQKKDPFQREMLTREISGFESQDDYQRVCYRKQELNLFSLMSEHGLLTALTCYRVGRHRDRP